MKQLILIPFLVFSLLVLAGCGSSATQEAAAVNAAQVTAPEAGAEIPADSEPVEEAASGETLVDEQGAVVVTVTPLNLGQQAETLDFEIAMNTHTVELSMDLAQLATLTSDNGAQLTPSSWSVPQGGHHATGVLSFPVAGGSQALLDEATTLTLTLENVDVPVRTFTWTLKVTTR